MKNVKQLEALAAIAEKSELPSEELEKLLASIPTAELIEATKNENDYVREWAVYALKNRTGEAVRLALIEVMEKDESAAIKERAISSLSTKINDENVTEAIIGKIEDEDCAIGISAIHALESEPSEKVDKALVEALKNKNGDEIFGYTIVCALIKREHHDNRAMVRKAILEAVKDDRKMAQEVAERYIEKVINARQ